MEKPNDFFLRDDAFLFFLTLGHHSGLSCNSNSMHHPKFEKEGASGARGEPRTGSLVSKCLDPFLGRVA